MLEQDASRRFTQVEIKFFSMYWESIDEARRDTIRQLISEGRLEFANGGWSMHDEACPHYDDMMNNMLFGHEWIARNLG